MSLTPAALRIMKAKGLTLDDAIEIAEALVPARSANAERQARFRQRKKAKGSRGCNDDEGNVTDNVTPPNEYISNPPVPPQSANADCPTPKFSDRFVEAWNAEPGLKPARRLTGQRLTKLGRRVKEFGEETMLEAVARLGGSPFHCGKNDREWQADIGWLIRNEENVTKALELAEARPRGKPADPVDRATTLERSAAMYRHLGRDEDAERMEREAQELRCAA